MIHTASHLTRLLRTGHVVANDLQPHDVVVRGDVMLVTSIRREAQGRDLLVRVTTDRDEFIVKATEEVQVIPREFLTSPPEPAKPVVHFRAVTNTYFRPLPGVEMEPYLGKTPKDLYPLNLRADATMVPTARGDTLPLIPDAERDNDRFCLEWDEDHNAYTFRRPDWRSK